MAGHRGKVVRLCSSNSCPQLSPGKTEAAGKRGLTALGHLPPGRALGSERWLQRGGHSKLGWDNTNTEDKEALK